MTSARTWIASSILFVLAHSSIARCAQVDEPKAIQQAIENYFALIGKKDLERAMGFWHPDAPDREAERKKWAAIFAETGPISIEKMKLTVFRRDGNLFRFDLEVAISGTNAKTKQSDPRLGTINRLVEVVGNGDRWQLWKSRDFFEFFISLYSKELPDKRARQKWLQRNRNEADNLLMVLNSVSPDHPMKERVELNALAFEAAEFLDSIRDRGWCHFHRAVLQMDLDVKEFAEALRSLDRALADFRKDEYDEGEACSLLFRGRVYVRLEQPAKAVEDFEAAERLFRIVRFTSIREEQYFAAAGLMRRWDQRDAFETQARQKWQENQPAEAMALLEKIAALERSLFGLKHWEIAGTHNWRGRLFMELGRFEEANKEFAAAIEMDRWLRGPNADEARAGQVLEKRLARLLELAAPEREEFWVAERKYREASLLSHKGDLDGAEKAIRKTIDLQKKLLGAASTECAISMQFLADTLASKDKQEEARELYKRVMPILFAAFGERGKVARQLVDARLGNLKDLTFAQYKSGNFETALSACSEYRDLVECEPIRSMPGFDKARVSWIRMLDHLKRVVALPPDKKQRLREVMPDAIVPKGLVHLHDETKLNDLIRRVEAAREVLHQLLGEADLVSLVSSISLAEVYVQAKQLDRGLKLLKSTLSIMERTGMQSDRFYATYLGLQGTGALLRGDIAAAGQMIQQSVAKLRELQGPAGEDYLQALERLATWYYQTGQLRRAHDTAVDIARARKQLLLGNKGAGMPSSMLLEEGKIEQPYSVYRSYVAILLFVATCRIDLNYSDDGTERLLKQAMAILRQTVGEQHTDYTRVLRALANLAYRAGDSARTKDLYLQAFRIIEQLPDASPYDRYECLFPLGGIARRDGDYAEAERIYRKLLPLARESYGTQNVKYLNVILHLSEIEAARGRFAEALKLEQERLTHEQALISNVFTFASEGLMQAFLGEVRTIDNILSIALAAGKEPSPETTEMLWNWVFRRRGVIFESYCAFRDAQRSAAEDPEIGKQLEAVRSLRRRIAQLDLDPPAGVSSITLAKQKQAARDEADRLEAAIDRALARKRPDLVPNKTVVFADLSKKLAPDAVLVEFVRYHPRRFRAIDIKKEPLYDPAQYLAFVLPPGGAAPRLITLGEAKPIDDGVAGLRAAIELYPNERKSGRSEETLELEFRKVASELGRKLIEPLRTSLKDKSTLLITPDDRLHNLPFSTLVDKDGKFLIESVRCGYLASGRDLLRSAPSVVGEGVVVFADPDFDALPARLPRKGPPSNKLTTRGPPDELRSTGWKRLEGAAEEGTDLGKIISKGTFGPVRVLEGINATKDELRAVRSPRILHFATHGYYFERREKDDALTDAWLKVQENPLLRSGLVLAGANKWKEKLPQGSRSDDGWVTAEEVAQFDLSGTDLVVLSACQTGLGDLKEGDGVYGLRRAFQYAGVRSLVTSLFEVPDEATHSMMTHFYEYLVAGKGKLGSLHESQLKLRNERLKAVGAAHPFYWGGFILTGDP